MNKALLFALAFAAPAQAEVLNGDILFSHINNCARAMETGEVAGFEGLTLETEVTTDTTLIRGWRGQAFPGLVISLIRRVQGETHMGMCDVSFTPSENDMGILDELAVVGRDFMAELRANPDTKVDQTAMSKALITCAGAYPVSFYLDEGNLDKGFNSQFSRVSPSKLECPE